MDNQGNNDLRVEQSQFSTKLDACIKRIKEWNLNGAPTDESGDPAKVTDRFVIKINDTLECYDIIDTHTILGTEDKDYEIIARVFDSVNAMLINRFLNSLI